VTNRTNRGEGRWSKDVSMRAWGDGGGAGVGGGGGGCRVGGVGWGVGGPGGGLGFWWLGWGVVLMTGRGGGRGWCGGWRGVSCPHIRVGGSLKTPSKPFFLRCYEAFGL